MFSFRLILLYFTIFISFSNHLTISVIVFMTHCTTDPSFTSSTKSSACYTVRNSFHVIWKSLNIHQQLKEDILCTIWIQSAYTILVRAIPEYIAVCWVPYREEQINALYRVQSTAFQFTHHTKYSDWKSMAQCRTIAHLCAIFKAYSEERSCKATRDSLRWPHYLNIVEHCRKN